MVRIPLIDNLVDEGYPNIYNATFFLILLTLLLQFLLITKNNSKESEIEVE